MGEIDWSKLYQATSKANQPTPGYLFNEIVRDVSNANPREIPAVAAYLADCVDGEHAHVKLKALFVIKALAYRVPPFCSSMQERLASVKDATEFTGPPSALFGDEPYRLVREAAEGALTALTGGEYYHEQYREMSQRIVGFGNYQPSEDTVLPDGTINVGRDVTYRDLTLSTVELIQSGLGSILGGVKEILASPFTSKRSAEGLGAAAEPEDVDDPEGDAAVVIGPGAAAAAYGDDGDPGDEDDGLGYQPSAGSYVPPILPDPGEEEAAATAEVWAPAREEVVGVPEAVAAAPEAEADEGALLQLLGLPGGGRQPLEPDPEEEGRRLGAPAEPAAAASHNASEAEILEILGLAGPQGDGGEREHERLGAPAQVDLF